MGVGNRSLPPLTPLSSLLPPLSERRERSTQRRATETGTKTGKEMVKRTGKEPEKEVGKRTWTGKGKETGKKVGKETAHRRIHSHQRNRCS
jgi:hypothetical protein